MRVMMNALKKLFATEFERKGPLPKQSLPSAWLAETAAAQEKR